jgi:hypothetical protein
VRSQLAVVVLVADCGALQRASCVEESLSRFDLGTASILYVWSAVAFLVNDRIEQHLLRHHRSPGPDGGSGGGGAGEDDGGDGGEGGGEGDEPGGGSLPDDSDKDK